MSDENDDHCAGPGLYRGDGTSGRTLAKASECDGHRPLMTVHRIYPLDGIVVFVHVSVRTHRRYNGRLVNGIGDDGYPCIETGTGIAMRI